MASNFPSKTPTLRLHPRPKPTPINPSPHSPRPPSRQKKAKRVAKQTPRPNLGSTHYTPLGLALRPPRAARWPRWPTLWHYSPMNTVTRIVWVSSLKWRGFIFLVRRDDAQQTKQRKQKLLRASRGTFASRHWNPAYQRRRTTSRGRARLWLYRTRRASIRTT
ncbi:hypothetical protein BC830DRAFT_1113829 [Chytriomyces sp. MP71]|nr:hypothetical protein BC830DRAFT_1113829 [Chytriomyces sp. MP71]